MVSDQFGPKMDQFGTFLAALKTKMGPNEMQSEQSVEFRYPLISMTCKIDQHSF